MWQQLRSTVADVKEFGTGALTEVSQGVSQGRKLAAESAKRAAETAARSQPNAAALAGAAASFVDGRRRKPTASRDSSADLDTGGTGVDPSEHQQSAVDLSGPSNGHVAARPVPLTGNADHATASADASEHDAATGPAASPVDLTRDTSSRPAKLLSDEGRSTQGGTPVLGTPGSAGAQHSEPLAAPVEPEQAQHQLANAASASEQPQPPSAHASSAHEQSAAGSEAVDTVGPEQRLTGSSDDALSSTDGTSSQHAGMERIANAIEPPVLPAAEAAPSYVADDALLAELEALRSQNAKLQQQVAVERQLAKAAASEKADIEASLAGLTAQVQERDADAAAARAEAAGLAAERHAVDAAVEELRTMLMQSVAERSRLAGEAEAAEQRMTALQRDLDEKAAAMAGVQAQASGFAAKLSEAEAALERNTEANSALSLVEREGFEAQLASARQVAEDARSSAAAAEGRAEKAERAQAAAEAARDSAEQLRQQIQAEAEAAAAVADLERQQRAAATGEAEALRADAERRAKAFNAAVSAAVGRIRTELEAECSGLTARLQEAEQRLSEAQLEAEQANSAAAEADAKVEAAGEAAAAAEARAAEAQQAAANASGREQAAHQTADAGQQALLAAQRAQQDAEQQLAAAQQKRSEAETRAAAAEADAQTAKGNASAAESRGAVEAALWRERAEEAVSELQKLMAERDAASRAMAVPGGAEVARQGAGAEATLRRDAADAAAAAAAANSDAAHLRRQVVTLEQEAAELRAAARRSAAVRLPGAGDVLSSLGLDSWKDARLGPKVKGDEDLEVGIPRSTAAGGSGVGLMGAASARRREVVSQMRGTVSMRTWLIIAYLTVLHFALMASFTRRGGALTGYDLEQLCAGGRAHSLPGT